MCVQYFILVAFVVLYEKNVRQSTGYVYTYFLLDYY